MTKRHQQVTINLKTQTHQQARQLALRKQPTVTVVYSKYTYNNALNIQMARAPQVNYGSGWYNASRSATSAAMNNAKYGITAKCVTKCLI